MSTPKPYQFETAAIHAGELHEMFGAHIGPIYQTSTFSFADMEEVDAVVAGEKAGYVYGRSANPTRKALADKIAALEGHDLIWASERDPAEIVAAEVFSSGMAAISVALLGCAQAGQHVITQDVLYGSSDHLINELLPQYGISSSTVKGLKPEGLEAELVAHPNTTVVYLETPANPTMVLVDLARVTEIAHAHGAWVIVDNTFASPMLQRPLSHGVDVVVHSTTKYMGGHGTFIGGAVVCRDVALLTEKIGPMIKYFGGVPSPFDCWLTNLGLKTLPLRMRQHCANAMGVARFLEDRPEISAVHYPGLESFPQHDLARQQMSDFGAMMAIEVVSGFDGARRLLGQVKLCTLAVSLGNVDTLIEHPASMTHKGLSPEDRQKKGITDGLIRLSVGLEAVSDIIADLGQAMEGVG